MFGFNLGVGCGEERTAPFAIDAVRYRSPYLGAERLLSWPRVCECWTRPNGCVYENSQGKLNFK